MWECAGSGRWSNLSLAPPTVCDSFLAGCLHVCLQLQVSSGCVFTEPLRNMFPQAQVELFIMCSSVITTLPDLIKGKAEADALKRNTSQSLTLQHSSQTDGVEEQICQTLEISPLKVTTSSTRVGSFFLERGPRHKSPFPLQVMDVAGRGAHDLQTASTSLEGNTSRLFLHWVSKRSFHSTTRKPLRELHQAGHSPHIVTYSRIMCIHTVCIYINNHLLHCQHFLKMFLQSVPNFLR